MANQQQKIYRISVQTDAAQQEVGAISKKVAELDAQLAGLDQNSDAAKAIVAEMAKLTKQLTAAEGEVDDLNRAMDSLKPGSIGALRAEIEDLEAALDATIEGTAEYNAALLKLGNAKGAIKAVDDAVDALDPKMKAAAFLDFANGVVGAFTVATTAAQAFGLSKETAEEYQQKLLGLISVMQGVEQVSRALNSETLAVVKSGAAAAKGFLGFGEAAQAGSKAARVAIASTGIGLLIVALGAIYALWQDFGSTVKGSESNFTKFKATLVGGLQAAFAIGKDLLIMFYQFETLDFSGLKKTFNNLGKDTATAYAQGRAGVIDEARRAELAAEADKTSRLIDILKAQGADTLAIEVANAKRKLEAQKAGSKESLDATRDYLVLKAQLEKRADDEHQAARLAFLTGLASAEAARGADTFRQQLAAKQEQIAQLRRAELDGEHVTQAQKLQLLAEYDALVIAHDKQQADKKRALQGATLQAQLVRLQASTTDESLVQLQANAKQIEIAQQHRATLLAAADIDKAALVAADAELYKLRLDRSRIFYAQQAEQAQTSWSLYLKGLDGIKKKEEERETRHQADVNRAQAAGARVTQQVADELAANLQQKAIEAAAKADVAGNLLMRLFGVSDAQAQKLKVALAQSFETIKESVGPAIDSILSSALADSDAAIQAAQDKLTEIDNQLSQATSKRQADEDALKTASGARRDYLISRINLERTAEQKLAAEKQKAAREEQQAQREKAKLDKIQQEITAGTSAVEAILLSIKAAKAVVDAASHGKVGYDNIALAIAAAVAIGTSIISVKNAVKTMGDGGVIEGGSHASGNDVPVMGGKYRVEGGEGILPVDSTNNNYAAFELLRTKGRKRTLTLADFAEAGNVRVLPPPSSNYADGGILSSISNSNASKGQVMVNVADLSLLLENSVAMLAHLQSINGATMATAGHTESIKNYGPANLQIGPFEAKAIKAEEQKADQAQGMVTL